MFSAFGFASPVASCSFGLVVSHQVFPLPRYPSVYLSLPLSSVRLSVKFQVFHDSVQDMFMFCLVASPAQNRVHVSLGHIYYHLVFSSLGFSFHHCSFCLVFGFMLSALIKVCLFFKQQVHFSHVYFWEHFINTPAIPAVTDLLLTSWSIYHSTPSGVCRSPCLHGSVLFWQQNAILGRWS